MTSGSSVNTAVSESRQISLVLCGVSAGRLTVTGFQARRLGITDSVSLAPDPTPTPTPAPDPPPAAGGESSTGKSVLLSFATACEWVVVVRMMVSSRVYCM